MSTIASTHDKRGATPAISQGRTSLLFGSILLAVAIIAPFFLYPIFVMQLLCLILFACGYNLLMGYAGLLAFGHAAFFGGGCYATAYALKFWGWTPETAILFGAAASAIMGAVFGWLAIRRQGLYFAMITLALAQIVYFVALQVPWTGGDDGMHGISRGRLFGIVDLTSTAPLYTFVLVVTGMGFLLVYRTVHSPFGQVLRAIRDNEARATSLGYNVTRYKLLAFTLSASLAGIAGGTKTVVLGSASLTDVMVTTSSDVVLMVLIGGIGTTFGPIVGAIVYAGMQTYLASAGAWVTIIQGTVFVCCIMMFRKGLVGQLEEMFHRRRQRGAAKSPAGHPNQ